MITAEVQMSDVKRRIVLRMLCAKVIKTNFTQKGCLSIRLISLQVFSVHPIVDEDRRKQHKTATQTTPQTLL